MRQSRAGKLQNPLATALLMSVLSGCAGVAPEQRSESDPLEPLNRAIFEVNTTIDKATLKPVAKAYEAAIPSPVRTGVGNFMRNLETPGSSINNLLQGKPAAAFSELLRFVINTTWGVAGIFDVASQGGIESKPEDFGQTAAVWGVPAGPYVMLPFRGPSTLRDALLMPVDWLTDPLYQYDDASVRDKLVVLRIIDMRARLLTAEKFLEDSKDRYITLRESYLQNREFEVYDGNPPEDDDFFDEFFEEP